MRPWIGILWTVLFWTGVSPALAQRADCRDADTATACTEQGRVRGVVEGDTLAFKGIPYARPPIGALRWRPPEPAEAWRGVRDGSRFGPICPQLVGNEVQGNEDCLSVNVWRPRAISAKQMPVMIWLTGGGNHSLSGEGTSNFDGLAYNGTLLVPQGIVFVSYNLRLGVLGFLAHPALDAERPEKISGNYGSLDQIAMLRWVKANIGAFGGDPNRIFLFGTSAGGGNICALISSPLTRGLIHGVAMESSVPTGCELQTLADVEARTGTNVARAMGCDKAADVAACLRSKSAKDLVSAVPGTFTVLPRVFGPNVDGHVFPDQPLRRLSEGDYPAMPVIIGNTSAETRGWANTAGEVADAASYQQAIERVFGAAAAPRIIAKYPLADYATPQLAFTQVTTDAEFTCQSRRVARLLAKRQNQPVFRYLFAHSMENDPALKATGPVHTIEHAFLFPGSGEYQLTARDREIQREMIGYWTRMAKSGDPNGDIDPQWPRVTPEQDGYLEFGANTVAKIGPAPAKCAFWDSVTLPWPHL